MPGTPIALRLSIVCSFFALGYIRTAQAGTYSAAGAGIEWTRAQSLGLYADGLFAFNNQSATMTAGRLGLAAGLGGARIDVGIGRIGTEAHAPGPVLAGFLNGVLVEPWWISSFHHDPYGGVEITGTYSSSASASPRCGDSTQALTPDCHSA
jgi:hypothetical protein